MYWFWFCNLQNNSLLKKCYVLIHSQSDFVKLSLLWQPIRLWTTLFKVLKTNFKEILKNTFLRSKYNFFIKNKLKQIDDMYKNNNQYYNIS